MIDPEFEMWLGETWERNTPELKPDPLDAFFERCEIEKSLGYRITEPGGDPPAVEHLREFVKLEKQKVPQMTMREIRSSAVQLLRKTADALAAI